MRSIKMCLPLAFKRNAIWIECDKTKSSRNWIYLAFCAGPRPNRCVTKNWWQYVDVRRWWRRRWWYWDHLDVGGILIFFGSKQNNNEIYLFFSAEEFEHWYSRSCCHRDREQQNTNWTQIHHFGFLCVFLYKYLSSDWIISVFSLAFLFASRAHSPSTFVSHFVLRLGVYQQKV